MASPLGARRIAREASSRLATVERGEASTSLDWRLDKWKLLLPKWEASPLVGQGLGTTTTTKAIPGDRFSGKPPHNEYVRYLVETGIIGFAILLWALTILVRSLLRRRRTWGASDVDVFDAATLALVVVAGCVVNALADNTLLNSPTCYAAALIVIAALSAPRQISRAVGRRHKRQRPQATASAQSDGRVRAAAAQAPMRAAAESASDRREPAARRGDPSAPAGQNHRSS